MASRIRELSAHEGPTGPASQRVAFQALMQSATALNVRSVCQCDGYHADGFVTMHNDQKIPIEIKETLGWPQLKAAGFQLVSINHWLKLEASEAWIIFEQLSNEWTTRFGDAALARAERELAYFNVGMSIKLLQLQPSGSVVHVGGQAAA